MSNKCEYRLRFFEAHGQAFEETDISVASVAMAVRLAAEIAAELEAQDFSILPLPPKVFDLRR